MAIENPIWNKLRTGEIDANDQQLFLSILLKGLVFNLNRDIKVRGVGVPHYILNTGDDINYLEIKGQDHSIEPLEVSNEDYMYSIIPRCMVQPAGLNILTDQLTSPYTHGNFEFEYDDTLYNFTAEFRRLPIKLSVTLKYILDNYTDSLQAIQQILTKCAFIKTFTFIYLGQTIKASYKIPDDYNTEMQMEFDGLAQDLKTRNIEVSLEVETNLPIIYPRTLCPSDAYVKGVLIEHIFGTEQKTHKHGI